MQGTWKRTKSLVFLGRRKCQPRAVLSMGQAVPSMAGIQSTSSTEVQPVRSLRGPWAMVLGSLNLHLSSGHNWLESSDPRGDGQTLPEQNRSSQVRLSQECPRHTDLPGDTQKGTGHRNASDVLPGQRATQWLRVPGAWCLCPSQLARGALTRVSLSLWSEGSNDMLLVGLPRVL